MSSSPAGLPTAGGQPEASSRRTYPGEVPTLLKKAAALATDHGAAIPVLAEALKLSPKEVRDLLGEVDHRPVLRLVSDRETHPGPAAGRTRRSRCRTMTGVTAGLIDWAR